MLSLAVGSAPLHAQVDPTAAPAGAGAAPAVGVSVDFEPTLRAAAAEVAHGTLGGRHPLRVDVQVGALDPRLRLAPCRQVQTYLPAGHKAWGRSRIGARCVDGPVRWNVSVPVTVRVFAQALVAAQPLSAGTVLEAAHLRMAEVDWAEVQSPAFRDSGALLGRSLAHNVQAGQAVRDADLRRRQWFSAGEPVQIQAAGAGFLIQGEGVALSPGLDGHPVRVRTDSGRTLTGVAVGERRVALPL